ncbi:Tubulin delta chain [Phytophthora fragariae]|uniref:Tubulin delta chain n=1 Tax=Phytophthora fragariae TaxID=53985 RepID=A0A6A3S866_9STRA|nr:Tubulin delta chain [Phytophthora fragariae]KAE9111820.1 Tubulin delta chain [Phytophthora fragariae]
MLTLQVGQCGNQLGRALFDKLAAEQEADTGDSSFFHSADAFRSDRSVVHARSRRRARAVLVDMEPKVIQQCYKMESAAAAWEYGPKSAFTRQSGSGNNWASGYRTQGTQVETELLDLLQSEAERCDLLSGFLTLQSAAGGTGSGLGSFLTEELADFYPSTSLLNAVVWPYQSGEVIVQNYNAMLTMASLADAAHGIFMLQNDAASLICQKLLRIPHPSFDAMNEVLAAHLASSILPVGSNSDRSFDLLGEIRDRLCQHPGFKLLDIKMVPLMPHRSKKFSTHTWTGVVKHLHQMQVANAAFEEGVDWDISLSSEQGRVLNRSVGNLLILRGKNSEQADAAAFSDPRMYTPWSMDSFQRYSSASNFNSYDKTGTLISNSKAMVQTLAVTMDKAYDMFSHGAYLHQYERFGIDRAFFQEAFLRIDQITQNYASL